MARTLACLVALCAAGCQLQASTYNLDEIACNTFWGPFTEADANIVCSGEPLCQTVIENLDGQYMWDLCLAQAQARVAAQGEENE